MTMQPGMMEYQDCQIQVIDTPGITQEFLDHDVLELVRTADLVLLLIDLASDTLIEDAQAVMQAFQASKTRLGKETSFDPTSIGTSLTKTLMVFNKIDAVGAEEREKFFHEIIQVNFETHRVSTVTSRHWQTRRSNLRNLGKIRVYSRDPETKQADLDRPFVLNKGDSLLGFASLIHEELAKKVKSAKIWPRDSWNER